MMQRMKPLARTARALFVLALVRELGIRISVPQRMIVRDGPDGEPL